MEMMAIPFEVWWTQGRHVFVVIVDDYTSRRWSSVMIFVDVISRNDGSGETLPAFVV